MQNKFPVYCQRIPDHKKITHKIDSEDLESVLSERLSKGTQKIV